MPASEDSPNAGAATTTGSLGPHQGALKKKRRLAAPGQQQAEKQAAGSEDSPALKRRAIGSCRPSSRTAAATATAVPARAKSGSSQAHSTSQSPEETANENGRVRNRSRSLSQLAPQIAAGQGKTVPAVAIGSKPALRSSSQGESGMPVQAAPLPHIHQKT